LRKGVLEIDKFECY